MHGCTIIWEFLAHKESLGSMEFAGKNLRTCHNTSFIPILAKMLVKAV